MSNDAAGNEIVAYTRATDGNLTYAGSYSTGGKGLGAGLGSQGGLVFEPSQGLFFVVNAGDNSISMLSLNDDGSLSLLSNVPSGGTGPNSITVSGSTVYVANIGSTTAPTSSANITGFSVSGKDLVPIAKSTQALSAANPLPVDVSFTPDGKLLVVAEKLTNMIDTFVVGSGGVAGSAKPQVSAGQTPFGFSFDAAGDLLVSEAAGGTTGASTVSSYTIAADGTLTTVTAALPTGQSAACWLEVAGPWAYVANAESADITALGIGAGGALALATPTGDSASTGAGAVDLAVTPDNGFLYSLGGGDHTLTVFDILPDGTLAKQPPVGDLPLHAAGLVAR